MGGRGPNPKDPAKRARRNKDEAAQQVVVLHPVAEVEPLPETFMTQSKDGSAHLAYPEETRQWWQNWVDSPFSDNYDVLVWERIRMIARLHALTVYGDMDAFKEYRLQMNNFPETPGDRLRQRIHSAQAIDAEITATNKVISSRQRFPGMAVVDELEA